MRAPKRITQLVLVTILALGVAAIAPTTPADEEIPRDVKKALDAVIDAKIKDLKEQKNEKDRQYLRGVCAKNYRPQEDGTYRVTFYKDTIFTEKEVKRERFDLTLASKGEDEWEVTNEELVTTLEGFIRPAPGDETYYTFDSFEFSEEGLGVSSGPGSLVVDYRGDEKFMLILTGERLSYEYAPPREGADYYTKVEGADFHAVHELVKEEEKKDFIFTPARVEISCVPPICEKFLETLFSGLSTSTRDAMNRDMMEHIEEQFEETDENRDKNNFRDFYPVYDAEEGNLMYRVEVYKDRGDHWVALDYDNFEAREVSFIVKGYGPVFRYYSAETRASDIDLRTLEVRPDKGSRFYDITSVVGEVEMGTKNPEAMDGDVTFEVRAHVPVDRVEFFLWHFPSSTDTFDSLSKKQVLRVQSVTDDKGNDLTYIQYNPFQGLIFMPEKLKPGERTKIRMQWENPKAIRDYSYSFKAVPRGGWLPLLRIFDLVEEFELTVKTPEEYKVLGIGGKISDTVEGEVRTTKWRADHPVTFPSIIYGDYFEVESSVQAKKIDGTPIPVTIHVDKVSMSEYQLVPRQLQTLVDEAAQSINLYEAIFQVDYPFDKLDLVNDPVPALYGQAPSSVIYLGSLVFRSMGTLANLGSSRMDATRISRFMRSVVAHEVGHQWWGASVSNANSGNYWFVESLAEYASAYYLEYAYGQKEYDAQVKEWRDTILRAEPLASVQNASIMWSGDKGFGNYQAAVYNKGPYAFHILRETFGDEKFLRFMRMLSRSLAKKQIVTRDIQYIAEVAFGGDMGWFFDQWIRGIGMPQLTYDVSYRATEDGQYVVEGKVQQEIVLGEDDTVLEGRAFRGAVPILIEYRDGGEHEQVLLIEGEETEFRFKVPKEPRKILFNNSGEILFKSMDKASL